MMSPFHLHFHLGAEGIIYRARTVQTLRWSLKTGHFIFIDAKQIKATNYGDKLHFRCLSLYCYDRLDLIFVTIIKLGQ